MTLVAYHTAMQNLSNPIPLSLYIHLPWCVKKCPYCDFNSHALKDNLPEELYVAALQADFKEQLAKISGREIVSIFFGGGTPSLFSPEAIEKILTFLNQELSFHPEIEITLEANPGTVDESRFKGFKAAGVNRLSIGVQSLQDDKLKILGRIHGRQAALRAIEAAGKAGFNNFNIDLMHGLPNQTVAEALQDLKDALQFAPRHLSWYQLTIEPNTFFHYQPPLLPADEILWEIQEAGKVLLAESGLEQYEVSAYAAKDSRCKHNLNYWEFGDYLGIGAGAHSKLTLQNKIHRHWQVKNPKDYLDNHKKFVAEEKIISEHDCKFEFMLNALRLTEGVPITLFQDRTALTLNQLEPILSQAKQKNLLMSDPHKICATNLGQRFLNDLVSMFL